MRGRDLVTGLPKEVDVTIGDIRDAHLGAGQPDRGAVTLSIGETPERLLADIMDSRDHPGRRGALLKGLDVRLEEGAKMPVPRGRPPAVRRAGHRDVPGEPRGLPQGLRDR